MSRTTRVAFVAYHFPPFGGGLCHRSLKYAKYLPDFDIDLQVFTSSPTAGDTNWYDDALLDEVPECVQVNRVQDPALRGGRAETLTGKLVETLWRAFAHPDRHLGWATAVWLELLNQHRASPFDAVFTTSFPWSTHHVGHVAKRELGLRWVSDFRDPWTLNYEARGWSRWRKLAHRRSESAVYRESDFVVLNTPGNRRDVEGSFDVDTSKLFVIPNGFDADDYSLAGPPPRAGAGQDALVHLLYLGGLRGDWFEGPLYRAIAKLREIDPESYRRLRVDFVGSDEPVGDLHDQLELGDVCRFHGYRTLSEIGAWIDQADACALLLPSDQKRMGWVPQKTYTYLLSGKPIFYIGPAGSTRDILQECRAGVLSAGDTTDDNCEALSRLVRGVRSGDPPSGATAESRAAYDKRLLSSKLAALLKGEAASISDTRALDYGDARSKAAA